MFKIIRVYTCALALAVGSCKSAEMAGKVDVRVEAFFDKHLTALHAEAYGVPTLKNRPDLYSRLTDSLYIAKGVDSAMMYMQEVSAIKAPIRNPGQYTAGPHLDRRIYKAWANWYRAHKTELVWDDAAEKPVLTKP